MHFWSLSVAFCYCHCVFSCRSEFALRTIFSTGGSFGKPCSDTAWLLAGHGEICHPHGYPHGDPQTSPQHSDPHEFLVWFSFKKPQVHVDRRVVGWSAGRHVDHPCVEGWQKGGFPKGWFWRMFERKPERGYIRMFRTVPSGGFRCGWVGVFGARNLRTLWQSSVHPKTLLRCLEKWSTKRCDASPHSTCRAEWYPGPRKPQIRNVQIRNLAVLEISPGTKIKNLLMPLLLMGCFPVNFQEVKRPLTTKLGKRPIKVGKRPIKEKRPIKAMVLVGNSVGCLMGCFRAPPPWRKTAPLKRPIKRFMRKPERGYVRMFPRNEGTFAKTTLNFETVLQWTWVADSAVACQKSHWY